MKRSCLLLLLFFCLYSAAIFSQSIDTTLAAYAANYQPEKLHIQFDKPAYTPGDTVWFKIYIMSGASASFLSQNCYADLYNESGKLLTHSVFPVIQSGAAGMFPLPDSLPGNVVYIKAYTAWMLNFDTAFLFQKKIAIIQKTAVENATIDTLLTPVLQFFPEGGEAVEEVPVRMAFKATNVHGIPVTISGQIVDNAGAVIDTFITTHDGMGSFHIMYKKGERYTARWTDKHKTYETSLPTAISSGASLEIVSSKNKKTFIIRRPEDAADSLQQLHIIAAQHQQLVYKANIDLAQTTTISGGIPTDKLSTGILQITLFSKGWKPLAERICFVNNNEAVFTPTIEFTQTGLEKRAKNTFTIDLPDSLSGNLSFAITDKDIGTDSNSNIISQLLLSGELKGTVYKPSYYFSNNSDSIAQQLDLVMLTNGWRRYHWEEITAGRMPVILHPAEENYFTFSGKIIGANKRQLISPGKIYAVIQAKDSSRQFASADIKPDGSFADSSIILFDSASVISHFSNKAFAFLKDVQFTNNTLAALPYTHIDSPSFTSSDTTGNARLRFIISEQKRSRELMKGATLQNVTVTTRALSRMQILDKRYATGMFQVGSSYQLDLTHLESPNLYRNVFDYLNNRIGTVIIQDGATGKVVLWKGSKTVVYLDEDPVPPEVLYSFPVENIAYAKAFQGSFFGNYGGGGSAIAIYSRKGVDRNLQPNIYYKMVKGYTLTKEFYSPDYETDSITNKKEDTRSTLYWNPMILTTPADKKLSFTFYNNDVSHAFRLILEGISNEGKLVHIEKVIE